MIIELRGVEFVNKGAELMLYAIIEKVRNEFPNVKFAMEAKGSVPVEKLKENNILQKINLNRRGYDLNFLGNYIPGVIKKPLNLVSDKDIDAVLDGSGFAFGDFWGAKKAQIRLSNKIEAWKKSGKKIIVLPQAFGKFEDKELQKEMRTIIQYADLIFARDKYSLEYLEGVKKKETIFLKPDFTNLIKGKVPDYFDRETMEVAIIPNNKLVESGIFKTQEEYISFLNSLIEIIIDTGKKPFFLIHEGLKDLKLAETVNSQFNKSVKIVVEENSLQVKGVIGQSKAVITSRFHGLVSALTQGVPCLSVGWSHKYAALMEDYDYAEGLIRNEHLYGDILKDKVLMILNEDSAKDISHKLLENSAIQKELSEKMWGQVFQILGGK